MKSLSKKLKILSNKTLIGKHLMATKSEPNLSSGGAGRDRTDDLLLAKQALSQLSYSPLNRTEAATNQLADQWTNRVVWWAWVDLNYRPHAYQACALTN
jgi:hypothetical protein